MANGNKLFNKEPLLWVLIVASGGGNYYQHRQVSDLELLTTDRYHGKDSIKDFALRDALISHNADNIDYVRNLVYANAHEHPPPVVEKALKKLENGIEKNEINDAMIEERLRKIEILLGSQERN